MSFTEQLTLAQLSQLREYIIWAETQEIRWNDPAFQENHAAIQKWLVKSLVAAENDGKAQKPKSAGLAPLIPVAETSSSVAATTALDAAITKLTHEISKLIAINGSR